MMAPTVALICGLIRNPSLMSMQVARLSMFKAEGLIDQIVLSTWAGELDRYPETREQLHRLDAIVIESTEPQLTVPGHAMHQSKCLTLGLNACPPDSFVLKMRPDVMPLSDHYRRILSREALAEYEPYAKPSLFERPVWVHNGAVFWPFYMNDMTYFGLAKDLMIIAGIDLSAEYYCNQLAAEQYFFMSHVLRREPLIRAYARLQRTMIVNDANGNAAYARAMLETPLLTKAWLRSARILLDNYYVGFEQASAAFGEETQSRYIRSSLADLASSDVSLPGLEFQPFVQTTLFNSGAWAKALLSKHFLLDADGERVSRFLSQVDEPIIDNPVFPSPEFREAMDRLDRIYVNDRPKVCLDPPETRTRFVPSGKERFKIIQTDDTVHELQQQINALSRQNQALTIQLNELRAAHQKEAANRDPE